MVAAASGVSSSNAARWESLRCSRDDAVRSDASSNNSEAGGGDGGDAVCVWCVSGAQQPSKCRVAAALLAHGYEKAKHSGHLSVSPVPRGVIRSKSLARRRGLGPHEAASARRGASARLR